MILRTGKKTIDDLQWEKLHRPERISGVYALMQGETLQYIGKSVNIWYRVGHHIEDARIPFDCVFFAPFPAATVEIMERELIKHFLPPYNTTHCGRKRQETHQILAKAEMEAKNAERQVKMAELKKIRSFVTSHHCPMPPSGKFVDIPLFGTENKKFEWRTSRPCP